MNIVVLCGGLSSERDVSIKSGEMITKALRKNGHRVILLDVFMGYGEEECDVSSVFIKSEESSMKVSTIPSEAPDIEKVKASRKDQSSTYFGPNVIAICQMADIVFMGLHGSDGENGKVQGCFDLHGIRYTGNGCLSSAIAMDKGMTKVYFEHCGIPTPTGFVVKKTTVSAGVPQVPYPCIVKPACGGSSIGVSIAHNHEEFEEALNEAFKWESEVVVEEFIEGREFSCGVIDGQALPVIEIAPKQGFYDYKNKYAAGSAVETCPANISDEITAEMQTFSERIVAALGIETYARIDFMLSKDEHIYCLEVNTLPGMTPTSLLPQEAAAVGIDFENLCEEIIRVSMNKYI